jgi:hypothetical protein
MSVGPDIASLLGGPPGAAPPGPPDTESPADADALDHVRAAIAELQQAESKEPDAIEKAALVAIVAKLHQWLANDQKSAEAAMGGGPATRALRKASAGY